MPQVVDEGLDFSDLFDDKPDEEVPVPASHRLLRAVSPPRKVKRTGFLYDTCISIMDSIPVTLDEAIVAEIEELQKEEHKGSRIGSVHSSRLRERADLIKKFIGDYECFEQTDDVEPKNLEAFFIARVRACSAFVNDKRERNDDEDGKWSATEEEENWLNEHLQHVVRCLLRTKMPMRLTQKAWTSDSTFHNIARGCIYLDPVDELVDKMKQNVHITDDNVVAFKRGVSVAKSMAALLRYPKAHLTDWEKDINEKLAALMLEPEAPEVVDDPPMVMVNMEELPFPEYVDQEKDEDLKRATTSSHGKRILKKEPGVFYSDRDVYEMTDKERVEYSSKYMERLKKTVRFSETDPEVRLVISDHIKTFIEQHKAAMGVTLLYPQNYTIGSYVGERFASTMSISYNKYREMCWVTDKALPLAQVCIRKYSDPPVPHLNPQKPKRYDFKTIIKKDGHLVEMCQTMAIPAHPYLVPRNLPPITEQNALLENHLNSLIKFGNFWQPNIKNGPKSAYNFCYGTAIISDSILEQANNEALDTAGIFCFPHPFNHMTIYTWIDAIEAEQFSIHDIVFVWGLDRLTTVQEGRSTLAELMTLYQMVRARMDLKFEEFRRRGFTRLTKPRYWFTTLLEVDLLSDNMNLFNKTMRLFIKRNNEVGRRVEPIGLLDWARSCQQNNIPIVIQTAAQQLDCFYDLLNTHIGVRKRRDNAGKRRDIKMHRERKNQVEWIEKMEAMKNGPSS